jgi:hypothetical protein
MVVLYKASHLFLCVLTQDTWFFILLLALRFLPTAEKLQVSVVKTLVESDLNLDTESLPFQLKADISFNLKCP